MKNFSFQKILARPGIISLYFFLTAGGLWHLLGVFQTLMRHLAAPLVAILALLAVWAILNRRDFQAKIRFLGWCGLVLVTSFLLEWLGVRTGKLFGEYFYGSTLQPQLFGVPLAIGGAWLVLLLASTAVWQRIRPANFWLSGFGIAFLMVAFDFVMEQAAPRLDYWYWPKGIPLQNYVAWFWISFVYIQIGLRLKVFPEKMPSFVFHLYWAQIIYFLFVLLK